MFCCGLRTRAAYLILWQYRTVSEPVVALWQHSRDNSHPWRRNHSVTWQRPVLGGSKGGSGGMFWKGPNDVWGGPNGALGGGQTAQRSWFFPWNTIDIMLKLFIVWRGPNHGFIAFVRGHCEDPVGTLGSVHRWKIRWNTFLHAS